MYWQYQIRKYHLGIVFLIVTRYLYQSLGLLSIERHSNNISFRVPKIHQTADIFANKPDRLKVCNF